MSVPQLKRRFKALVGIFRKRSFRSSLLLLGAVVIKNLRGIRLRLFGIQHVYGLRDIDIGNRDVVVLCSFRDGEVYLPHFLNYHRRLGVKHFVFMDNGSIDKSIKYICNQPDTTLFQSCLPYKKYKNLFKRFLCNKYARNNWALLLDIDECFDFPKSDEVGLAQLISYLDHHGYTSVAGHMLDMFADCPVFEPPSDETDLSKHYRYYDLHCLIEEPYSTMFGYTNTLVDEGINTLYGGVRYRFFGYKDLLTKHPLFRLSGGMGITTNAHDITYSKVADFTIVLYHYKFTSDFSSILNRALNEESYASESISYKSIKKGFSENPKLSLMTPESRELNSINELLENGFLRASDQFLEWVKRKV